MILNKSAFVYLDEIYAGRLDDTDDGFIFSYDSDYLQNPKARSISLTLPLRKEKYISNILFPFFDGLLPEGWMLEKVVKNWKLDSRDRFSILLVSCYDCIGNVTVKREKV